MNVPLSAAPASPFRSRGRGRPAPRFIQERAVDLLDQNAVVEVTLDRVGEIDDLKGGDFGIGERSKY